MGIFRAQAEPERFECSLNDLRVLYLVILADETHAVSLVPRLNTLKIPRIYVFRDNLILEVHTYNAPDIKRIFGMTRGILLNEQLSPSKRLVQSRFISLAVFIKRVTSGFSASANRQCRSYSANKGRLLVELKGRDISHGRYL